MIVNIKRGSSVWQILTAWGADELPINFCNLVWSFIWRLFVICVCVICTGSYFGFLLSSLAASFGVGFVIWSTPVTSTLVVLFAVLALVCILLVKEKLTISVIENPKSFTSNGVNIYRAWKGKYCPKVKEVI